MEINNYKSGELRQQYQYKSFTPSKINHAWLFTDSKMLQLLSEADRALGELNAYSQLVPGVDFFYINAHYQGGNPIKQN